jgi:hypothetical protein
MARLLYDLAGAEPERRFSPYCWRAKMALMHKGLPFDAILLQWDGVRATGARSPPRNRAR